MPNLLNFITGGGTLVSHQHTPLMAHRGTSILSVLTGLYGDKMGQPVTTAFGFYDTDRRRPSDRRLRTGHPGWGPPTTAPST